MKRHNKESTARKYNSKKDKPLEFFVEGKNIFPEGIVDSEAGITRNDDPAIDVSRRDAWSEGGYGDSGMGETGRPTTHKRKKS